MPNDPDQVYAAIQQALSNERLDRYRHEGDKSDADALGRYFYNCALCEALYPSLQWLEVVLRNSLDAAISGHYGAGWLSATSYLLTQRDQDSVIDAEDRLRSSKPNGWDHGDLVAAMSFGFWVGLLSKAYDAGSHFHSAALWPHLLRDSFPHIPKHQRQRAHIEGFLTTVRRLRNRVFHHEPIWHYRNLDTQHASIIEAIGWMCPEAVRLLRVFDRFPAIHQAGPAAQIEAITQTLSHED